MQCDVTVVAGSRYKFDERNGLTITNITKADDGEYTCRAEVTLKDAMTNARSPSSFTVSRSPSHAACKIRCNQFD